MTVREDGKPSKTIIETLSFDGKLSLVKAILVTGRTHQIRVHLAAIGHPVVGDQTYGLAGPQPLSRQFLHASRLGFTLLNGEYRTFECPLPEDLAKLLSQLSPDNE